MLCPVVAVANAHSEGGIHQRRFGSRRQRVASDDLADVLPDTANLGVSLDECRGLLIVSAQAKTNPWHGVVLGLPASFADLSQDCVVRSRIPAEPFLDA